MNISHPPRANLPYRAAQDVDRVIGKLKKPIEESSVDFSDCQLAKRYPSWETFLGAVADQRSAEELVELKNRYISS